MEFVEAKCGQVICAKLSQGEDLIKSIREIAETKNISAGAFFAIGTLSQARFYFYRPTPSPITLKEPLEIVACSGSISQKQGKMRVHGHIYVTDEAFRSRGGHLLEGSIVDSMVFVTIFEFEGVSLNAIGI
ncbi:MAG: DNA-binding protein [Candidatus Bathyarchaeota archaeon]|nr:MAG: DNA-binding protein [Candidatus Bathyarchaeota archaeon]